jgi:hypothetical protein
MSWATLPQLTSNDVKAEVIASSFPNSQNYVDAPEVFFRVGYHQFMAPNSDLRGCTSHDSTGTTMTLTDVIRSYAGQGMVWPMALNSGGGLSGRRVVKIDGCKYRLGSIWASEMSPSTYDDLLTAGFTVDDRSIPQAIRDIQQQKAVQAQAQTAVETPIERPNKPNLPDDDLMAPVKSSNGRPKPQVTQAPTVAGAQAQGLPAVDNTTLLVGGGLVVGVAALAWWYL